MHLRSLSESLRELWRDVRHGARALLRSRSVLWSGVTTVALAVASVAVVYGVFDAVVLRAVPGSFGDRLATISYTSASEGPSKSNLTHAAVGEIAGMHDIFAAVGAWKRTGLVWKKGAESLDLLGFPVSSSFFDLFGVPAAIGRTFRSDEDRPEDSRVVVLSDAFWRAQFGGDPKAIGRRLTLNGEPYEVIGVMPPEFGLPNINGQVWLPDAATNEEVTGNAGDHFVIARLRSGLAWDSAEAALRQRPPQRAVELGLDLRYAMAPLRDRLVGPVARAMNFLLGAVALVLGVACANVAILLLVHRSGRRRQVAVQIALGASRARIVRQAAIESMLLALGGGALGVMLAAIGLRVVRSIGPASIQRLTTAHLTVDVIGVGLIAAVFAGLLAGVLPAWRSARVTPDAAFEDGLSITKTGLSLASGHRGQAFLAFAQLTLVTILVVSSGLLLRSLARMLTIDIGMKTDHVLAFQIGVKPQLPGAPLPSIDADRIVADLRAMPGVEAADVMTLLPTGRGGFFFKGLQAERAPGDWLTFDTVRYQRVSDRLFDTLGMRVLRGRTFSSSDVFGSPRVAIVNEAFANAAWPGQNPVGRHIEPSHPAEIIGVVNDVRYDLGSASEPQVYYPWRQSRDPTIAVVVRYPAEASPPLRPLMNYLQALPGRAVATPASLGGSARQTTIEPRFYAISLSLFAAIALALAAFGVYGVSAHLLAQRTREIGIRIALGARPQQVRRLVFSSSAWLALVGVSAGVGGAMLATRTLQGMLFEISPLDSVAFVAAPVVVAVAVIIAAWAPVRRAGRLDPVALLRNE